MLASRTSDDYTVSWRLLLLSRLCPDDNSPYTGMQLILHWVGLIAN